LKYICDNETCRPIAITSTWMVSSMISITLPASEKQFCQAIRVRPAHSLKVFQLSTDVNWHPILQ